MVKQHHGAAARDSTVYGSIVRQHGELYKASCRVCESQYAGLRILAEIVSERVKCDGEERHLHCLGSSTPHHQSMGWSCWFPSQELLGDCHSRIWLERIR